MSNPTTVYIPKPVGDKPDKAETTYHVIGTTGKTDLIGTAVFSKDGSWHENKNYPDGGKLSDWFTHWLQPIQITEESPIAAIVRDIDKLILARPGEPQLHSYLNNLKNYILDTYKAADLARSAYIKQLEEQNTLLQESHDNLEDLLEKKKAECKAWCNKAMEAANQRIQLQQERVKIAGDAWEAATAYNCFSDGPCSEYAPDKETYLNQFK